MVMVVVGDHRHWQLPFIIALVFQEKCPLLQRRSRVACDSII